MLAVMLGVASGLSGCGGGGGGSSGGSSGIPPQAPQAPLITAQPSDLTVIAGQPATFSVAANGDAPITYQWRRGGVNIDGATAASYTLVLPQLTDSGSVWSVVVSNAAGSMSSAGATLTVKTGPGIRLVAGMPGGAGSLDGAVGRFFGPSGVVVDASGTVFVADSRNNTIRKISPAGIVSTLAGTAGVIGAANGTGTAASFNRPTGIALDKVGNILVADSSNKLIRQITPLGVVTTLAGTVGSTVAGDGPVVRGPRRGASRGSHERRAAADPCADRRGRTRFPGLLRATPMSTTVIERRVARRGESRPVASIRRRAGVG